MHLVLCHPRGAVCAYCTQRPAPSLLPSHPCQCHNTGLGSSAARSGTGEQQAGDVGSPKCFLPEEAVLSVPLLLSTAMKALFLQLKSVPGIVPCGCSIQGLTVSITALLLAGLGSFQPPPRRSGPAWTTAAPGRISLSLEMFSCFLKVSPRDPGLSAGSRPSQHLTSPANTTERGWAFFLLLPYQNVSLGLLVPSAVGFSFCS